MTPEQIIKKLLKTIDDSVNQFMEGLSPVQELTYKKLIDLSKSLDIYASGNLKSNLTNYKIIGRLNQELETIILNDDYLKEVSDFVKAYDAVKVLQNDYFASINVKFNDKKVFDEVRKIAVDDTITSLTESGLQAGYIEGVKEILQTNITAGGSYADMTKQLSDFVLGDKETEGGLVKYAREATTDAINTFSADYNRIVSDDLGLKYSQYLGSLLTTSRPFCVHMVAKRYFHESEVPEMLKGHIGDTTVPLNKKTGLPEGFIAGTNRATFYSLRAGYFCGHQIFGVPLVEVPQSIRDKFGD